MKKLILFAFAAIALFSCGTSRNQSVGKHVEKFDAGSRFMPGFTEDFSTSEPQHFITKREPLQYFSGVHSFGEENTDVLLMRIQPSDSAGPNYGPEIGTPQLTHFGTYSARLRMPRLCEVQPNVGMVTGLFTYRFTPGFGLSEIDFEWLMADPTIIYIGTWTSAPDDVNKLQRVGRTVNMAKGDILYTIYYSYHDNGFVYPVSEHHFDESDDAALTPRTIQAIDGYDASKQFYVYGFDWYPDRLRWWVEHPETGEKIVLWDYRGTTPLFSGIPQPPTNFMLNFWHTNNWSAETVPNSTEAPKYPYLLEVDWLKYEPFEDLSADWMKKNNY